MTRKEQQLFDGALLLLEDGSPPSPKNYLCMECEDFDETACTRCWQEYLFRVVNS